MSAHLYCPGYAPGVGFVVTDDFTSTAARACVIAGRRRGLARIMFVSERASHEDMVRHAKTALAEMAAETALAVAP